MKEAAKILGITRQTINYRFKKGWIKSKRDYRNFPVFTVTDIDDIKKWKSSLK